MKIDKRRLWVGLTLYGAVIGQLGRMPEGIPTDLWFLHVIFIGIGVLFIVHSID